MRITAEDLLKSFPNTIQQLRKEGTQTFVVTGKVRSRVPDTVWLAGEGNATVKVRHPGLRAWATKLKVGDVVTVLGRFEDTTNNPNTLWLLDGFVVDPE